MDSGDIVYSTSQTAVMDILKETSSITHSQAADQDFHEERGDQVSRVSHLRNSQQRGKSDDGSSDDGSSDDENSGDESSDDGTGYDGNPDTQEDSDVISHSLRFGRTTASAPDTPSKRMRPPNHHPDGSCLSEPAKRSDYHQSRTMDATSSINPTEATIDEFWGISHRRDSEESLNAVDGNCDAKEDSDHSTQSSCLGKTTVKSRQASDIRHPSEPRRMSRQASDVRHPSEPRRMSRQASDVRHPSEPRRMSRQASDVRHPSEPRRMSRQASDFRHPSEPRRMSRQAFDVRHPSEPRRMSRQASDVRHPSEPRRMSRQASDVRHPCESRRKSRQASDVRHPFESRRRSTPNLAYLQMYSVIKELVFYTMKKAKVSTSGKSIIKNLFEKAKKQINPNQNSITNVQNAEKIHKAVFKELVKKIGSAKEILKVMETQEADCVLIDILRIQLTSPKKKGFFARVFSSIGKFLRCRGCWQLDPEAEY